MLDVRQHGKLIGIELDYVKAEFQHLLVLTATYAFFYLDCVLRLLWREYPKRDLTGFLHQGQGSS